MNPKIPETLHDFGSGPVATKRHVNPDGSLGGRVAITAHVDPTAYVGECAKVSGRATVGPKCQILDIAHVKGNSCVANSSVVSGAAEVAGLSYLSDSCVGGSSRIGDANIYSADVLGTSVVEHVHIFGGNSLRDADVLDSKHVFTGQLLGFSWVCHRVANGTYVLAYGCERHTLTAWTKEFAAQLAKDHLSNDWRLYAKATYNLAKMLTALIRSFPAS